VRGGSARSRRATRRRVAGDRSPPSCGTKAASGSGRVDELGICSREVTPDPGYAIDLGPAPDHAERRRRVGFPQRGGLAAGQALGVDLRGQTIGVVTAIGDEDLINIDQSDAAGPDSRGIFQQRANGAWESYTDRMTPGDGRDELVRRSVPGRWRTRQRAAMPARPRRGGR
jgi:hypothetical protein